MPIAAEKDGRKIAVEVKSFLGLSALDDLEDALGQFGVYRAVLRLKEPDRALYLAVPTTVREMLMEEKDFRFILADFQARLIFYPPRDSEVLEWIEPASFETQ